MASSGAMFAASAGLNGISSIGNAYAQSQAIKAQTAYQTSLANINKNFADMASDEALKRGAADVAKVQKQVRVIRGSQRAALAAQGIDIGTGSALEIQRDTENQAAKDIVTIKNNAFRESFGYKVSALEATHSGKFAELTGAFQSKMTLLTGGMDALTGGLKSYATYKKA